MSFESRQARLELKALLHSQLSAIATLATSAGEPPWLDGLSAHGAGPEPEPGHNCRGHRGGFGSLP